MFEGFLKYPREAYEQGEFVLVNVVNEGLWIGISAVLAVALIASVVLGSRMRIFAWWQKAIVATLQVAVLLGVIALLTGPHWKTTKLQAGANMLAVLLDTSSSMEFADAAGPGTRVQAAKEFYTGPLQEELAELGDHALFTFAGSPRRVESFAAADASLHETRLLGSIDTVLQSFRGAALAGVIVLSDGADNDTATQSELQRLASYGVPVHTVGFGQTMLAGEAILADVVCPTDAPPFSQVTAELVIHHSVQEPAEIKAEVRDRGTLLAQQTIELDPTVPVVRTALEFTSGEAGIRELEFSIVPPESDVLDENNTAPHLLTVNERKRRVLYLEGEPRWEYKFIRRAIQGDDVVHLVSWLRTTDRKSYRQGVSTGTDLIDGFPADKAELYGYDLVILGSLAATALTDEQHALLETYVAERGGSVMVLAGRDALADGGWDVRPLSRALPVKLTRTGQPSYRSGRATVEVTREGRASPLLFTPGSGKPGFETLPPVGDYQLLGQLKPAATTLLAIESQDGIHPLLVTQPYGLGTTAVLATATTWRWQMSTPAEDERHSLFWRQLSRQLAESAPRPRTVDLKVEGESVEILAWARDALFDPEPVSVSAMVTFPDRTTAQLAMTPSDIPGLHKAQFAPGATGVSRIDVSVGDVEGDQRNNITRFVQVGSGNKEFKDPVQNAALLSRVASVTRGDYWQPESIQGLREKLSFTGSGVKTIELLPLWNLPAIFVLLIILKLGEWGLRRLWGGI